MDSVHSFIPECLSFFETSRSSTTMAQHTHHHHHHGSLSSTSGSSSMMVRKHRTMQRQRKYQQRVISWWIKLSVPPMALLLIYYFGTSRFLRDNNNHEDDSDDDHNKKKKKKPSIGSIAIWMQNSDAKSCRSEIMDRSDGHWPLSFLLANGGGGRDEAETVLRQSLVCFSPVSTTDNNNNNGIVTTASTSSTMVRSVWITGSTAAAGYGNRKQQSYPALVLASSLSSSSTTQASGTISVDVGRDMTEFPLAWCRGTTSTSSQMVLYDFQDDLQHFNITRLRDFVTYVQPTILMVRLSNDHDADSQRDIVHYLQSLVQQPEPEQQPPPLQQQQRSGSSNINSTTTATRSVRAVYIIDVSSVVVKTTTNDNEQMNHDGDGAVFGVANSPDSLHAHHLTLAQHERVATIVQLLMRYHGFYDDDDDVTAAVLDQGEVDKEGKEEKEQEIDDESAAVAAAGTSAAPNTNHRFRHCASGFGDATTTGRTPGTLHFVVDDEPSSSTNTITLPTVLPDCCGNSMDSVLLPNQDLRHLHWMWDALDASAKRRDLPFDQYGHTDWKIVVSGTPQSNALKVVLPVQRSSSESGGAAAVRQVRVCCAACDGMIISSSSSSADSTLQSVGYGCFDVHPPSAIFSISVPSGTCQISHILWQ
jgi:hypothetical protein